MEVVVAGLGIFIALIIGAIIWFNDECPRVILGYNCRGKNCDHDPLEVQKAKEARGEQ